MHYSPQHYFGFEVDIDVAEKLNLDEAFDIYEMSYDDEQFFEGFREHYGIEPFRFIDTTYERGGYVQGLSGFEWDRVYLCFAPTQTGDDKWDTMVTNLAQVGIGMVEARWSELG
jgi:hypothetical protein